MFGKERRQRHDQEPQLQRMRGLEEKNRTLDGRLFSVVGNGKRRAFCFPISLPRQTDNGFVDEFLVMTAHGDRAIQVDRGNTSFADAQTIGDIINRRLGKKHHFLSSGRGYDIGVNGKEFLHIRNGLSILRDRANGVFLEFDADDARCKLVVIEADRAEHLLQTNIETASREKATQALRAVLRNKPTLKPI